MTTIGHSRRRIRKEADRDAWLAQRAPFVGASEVAALFGDHPFQTAGDVALSKLGLVEEVAENSAMRRGTALEGAVAEWWSTENGIEVVEVPDLYVVDEVVVATLDRLILGTSDALEVKTTTRVVDDVERYWWWQAQAQAVAADLDRVRFAVLDGRLELRSFVVERDVDAGERIVDAASRFLGFVRAGDLPPIEFAPSYRRVQAMFPEAKRDEVVELPAEAAVVLSALRSVRRRIDRLQDDEDRLKGMLTYALGEATDGTLDGRLVCTWRPATRRDVDAKKLRADHPELAAEYERTSTSRRLLLK